MASTTVMLVSVDPSRIAASVVTGVGFLGGGVASTALGVIALAVLRRLERKEAAPLGRKITLALDATAPRLSPTAGEDLLGVLESQPGVRRVRIEPIQ